MVQCYEHCLMCEAVPVHSVMCMLTGQVCGLQFTLPVLGDRAASSPQCQRSGSTAVELLCDLLALLRDLTLVANSTWAGPHRHLSMMWYQCDLSLQSCFLLLQAGALSECCWASSSEAAPQKQASNVTLNCR